MVHALDAIEQLLQTESLDGESLAACQRAFEAALGTAEHGTGWPAIATRAHTLGDRLHSASIGLAEKCAAIKQELGLQAQGARALKGYKPF